MTTNTTLALRPLRDTYYSPSAYRCLYDDARHAYTSGEPLTIPAHLVSTLLDMLSPLVSARSFGASKKPTPKK